MKEVGTLKELGVCVGDVVEYGGIGDKYTICDNQVLKSHQTGKSSYYQCWDTCNQFRIIARANQPKLWKDMTADEKGALLLAAHEGNVIEWSYGLPWITADSTETSLVAWDNTCAYRVRIKPEPKVETVTQHWKTNKKGEFVPMNQYDVPHDPTHRITFTTSDGKPDCASVKMEEL